MNQADLQGTGENVTFIHSILLIQERSGSLSAVARGCWEPRGQRQLQEAWVLGPFPDAAQVERTEPSWDTQVPCLAHQPWPQLCYRDAPTPPFIWCPVRPGCLAAGIVDFGVRPIWVSILTAHLLCGLRLLNLSGLLFSHL